MVDDSPPTLNAHSRLVDLHPEVGIALPLFEDGHYQESVRKAAERFINRVAQLAKREDLHGVDLMHQAFSGSQPVLVFSEQRRTPTEKSMHNGFRSLAVGLAEAVRNVYTHTDALNVSRVEALEWLAFISAMQRRLDRVSQYAEPPDDPSQRADSSEPDAERDG